MLCAARLRVLQCVLVAGVAFMAAVSVLLGGQGWTAPSPLRDLPRAGRRCNATASTAGVVVLLRARALPVACAWQTQLSFVATSVGGLRGPLVIGKAPDILATAVIAPVFVFAHEKYCAERSRAVLPVLWYAHLAQKGVRVCTVFCVL